MACFTRHSMSCCVDNMANVFGKISITNSFNFEQYIVQFTYNKHFMHFDIAFAHSQLDFSFYCVKKNKITVTLKHMPATMMTIKIESERE